MSTDYAKLLQRKLGELRLVATVSRPGTCARVARIASRIHAPSGNDVYHINELVRVAKAWQQVTVLKYASPPHPCKTLGRSDRAEQGVRKRGGRVHCGSMSLVGWSDAAYGNQSTEETCHLGYVIGLMSPNLKGPCHSSQWTSKFTQ